MLDWEMQAKKIYYVPIYIVSSILGIWFARSSKLSTQNHVKNPKPKVIQARIN